jgi:hypothetical protein
MLNGSDVASWSREDAATWWQTHQPSDATAAQGSVETVPVRRSGETTL